MDHVEMRHFAPEEFACKCGCGRGFPDMDPEFLFRLNRARYAAGIPFVLTSAFRCREHNASVPGASATSSHVKGLAVDIAAPDDFARYRIVSGLLAAGFDRVGISTGGGFVHVDLDRKKNPQRLWIY